MFSSDLDCDNLVQRRVTFEPNWGFPSWKEPPYNYFVKFNGKFASSNFDEDNDETLIFRFFCENACCFGATQLYRLWHELIVAYLFFFWLLTILSHEKCRL
jgi:hypothetical protein